MSLLRPRKSFAERNTVVLGVIGSVALVVALLVALNLKSLPFLGGGRTYHALFSEAGGLESGADVVVAGVTVGSVSSVSLDGGHVNVAFTVSNDSVRLGSRTRARISMQTVLGNRALVLDGSGPGTLTDGATIPLSRTTPPYDLADALSGLTTTTQAIDTAGLARALRTLSAAFQNTPAPLRVTVQSMSRLSEIVASRDAQISDLFGAANNVSGVLAQRSQVITRLLDDGSKLLGMLYARRDAIAALLDNATALAQQLGGLIQDNRAAIGPTLRDLTHVLAVLNAQKSNLQKALDAAGSFIGSLSESVSSGPFFSAYVQNLTNPVDLEGLDTSPLCVLVKC